MVSVIACFPEVGVVPCDKQESVCIFAAGRTYQLNKFAVNSVRCFVAFVLAENSVCSGDFAIVESVAKFLICGFKYQLVGIIGKMLAYLRPYGLIKCHSIFTNCLVTGAEHSPPASVPVVVQYNIHISVKSIIDYLVDTVHEPLVNGVISALVIYAIGPCHRNAESIEAQGFHIVYHIPCGDGLSPERFKGSGVYS